MLRRLRLRVSQQRVRFVLRLFQRFVTQTLGHLQHLQRFGAVGIDRRGHRGDRAEGRGRLRCLRRGKLLLQRLQLRQLLIHRIHDIIQEVVHFLLIVAVIDHPELLGFNLFHRHRHVGYLPFIHEHAFACSKTYLLSNRSSRMGRRAFRVGSPTCSSFNRPFLRTDNS